MEIMIYTKCKPWKKLDKRDKKSVITNLSKLAAKIESYNCDINRIFNADSITYDRINDSIFICKAHSADNKQLRVVYGIVRKENNDALCMIDFTFKKKNNKEYISEFAKYKDTKIESLTFETA